MFIKNTNFVKSYNPNFSLTIKEYNILLTIKDGLLL